MRYFFIFIDNTCDFIHSLRLYFHRNKRTHTTTLLCAYYGTYAPYSTFFLEPLDSSYHILLLQPQVFPQLLKRFMHKGKIYLDRVQYFFINIIK